MPIAAHRRMFLHLPVKRDELVNMTFMKIHTGDCLKSMCAIVDESVDLVVTSPPYNLGITYRNYEDRLVKNAYLN